ncbi:MAG TPA: hypothetical protein VE172_03565 [Stackebrandtia sp.]|uniref:hypothetical protein n=1 Tax=Stackebrandtia sp. TaxID=2023065 RepID=UPI002D6716A9|nr:hypothetical protein [Stackebrandtia sp.]HZE37866.1 hypothetical protein [Stackebrandtia sp.]
MSLLRRKSKHREQVKGELAKGIGHLRSATAYAADGARERLTPALDSALVRVGLRKKRRRRWPWVAGSIVVITAAAGTAGVIMMRRSAATTADDEHLFAEDSPAEDLSTYEAPKEQPATESRTEMASASVD